MPDLFSNSDYVSSSGTTATPAQPPVKSLSAQRAVVGESSIVVTEPQSFGLEPTRYGLGKPKRIVIKGKIARD